MLPPALERGPGGRHAAFGGASPRRARTGGAGAVSLHRLRRRRYIDPRIKEYQRSGSGWKQEWYARGPVVEVDAGVFFSDSRCLTGNWRAAGAVTTSRAPHSRRRAGSKPVRRARVAIGAAS